MTWSRSAETWALRNQETDRAEGLLVAHICRVGSQAHKEASDDSVTTEPSKSVLSPGAEPPPLPRSISLEKSRVSNL